MNHFVLELIGNYGYIGMFLGMILEAIIIIIPSELILATGGILASQGLFTFPLAFLVGLVGSVFCAVLLYVIGYFGGRPFIEKYGKFFFMKPKDLAKSDDWFYKYGMVAAFIGRNFPIVRTFISIPIGIARLNFGKFLLFTTLGSIPWTFAFVWVGYSLGNNWIILNNYINKIKVPIKILLIVLLISYLYKRIRSYFMQKESS